MRALVTGCAGFIGSHLVDRLLAEGYEVVGLDCFTDNYDPGIKRRNLDRARNHDAFELVEENLLNADLSRLLADVETTFHLAAEPGVRASWGSRFSDYVCNNVIATQLVLEEAKRHGDQQRVVYASSSSVYGQVETFPTLESTTPQPYSPYGVTKLGGEHLCRAYSANFGLPTVSLRFFTVYGPRQRPDMAFHIFGRAIIERERLQIFGDGTQTRDFTFVDDIVDALVAAGSISAPEGRVYNVGGGSRVSLLTAIETLADIAGFDAAVDYNQRVSGDVRDTGGDISAIARDLSFAPATGLADGLRAEFEWLSENYAVESGG
jgi:nucleoside-diphosphate-sugar epimerase